MLYSILKLCRERGSNPHAPFGARDFKRIFLSDYLISISFLTQGWTLLPVIKKINFSGSLYTFISLPMLGSPSILFIYGSNTSAEFIQFFSMNVSIQRGTLLYTLCLPIVYQFQHPGIIYYISKNFNFAGSLGLEPRQTD